MRTIHPLSETPLGRDPNGRCLCNWCRHWSPLLDNVLEQLDENGKKLLEEYIQFTDYEMETGSVDAAKLAGDWPGWEDLKGYNPETHRVILRTDKNPAHENS